MNLQKKQLVFSRLNEVMFAEENILRDFKAEEWEAKIIDEEDTLKHFIREAVRKLFSFHHKCYVYDKLISDNIHKELKENVDITEQKINTIFGSVDRFRLLQNFKSLNHYMRFAEAELKANKIKDIRTYGLVNGFITFFNPLYVLIDELINKRTHKDYGEINKRIEALKLNQKLYEHEGIVVFEFLELRLFKNGRLDITLTDDIFAKKVFDEIIILEKEFWKKREELER